jgi:gliding motility-associated-like protein
MKKRLTILLFCLTTPLLAQTSFQKSLSVYMDSTLIRSAPDGQSVYIGGITKRNSITNIYITRLDGQGMVLWQQVFTTNGYTFDIKSIVATSDGVVALISEKPNNQQANGFLMKLNTLGNIVWSQRIDAKDRTQVFEIERDDAENIWLSGLHLPPPNNSDSAYYFLMQFRPDGTVPFVRKNVHHYFINTPEDVYKVTHLAWHSASATMSMIEDFDTPYNSSGIIAFNRQQFGIGFCDANRVSSERLYGFQFANRVTSKSATLASGYTVKEPYFNKDLPAIALMDAKGEDFTIIKTTQNVQQTIHTNSKDIVFYEPTEKTLTKYDTSLNPIWTKKFDNCLETTKFAADVAIDGSIYTIRNIKNQTIVSRILPTGTQPSCKDYDKPPISIKNFDNYERVGNYSVYGFYSFSFLNVDSLLPFNFASTTSNDFCVKFDAAFDLPDTVCIGASIKPLNVDTTSDMRHSWSFLTQYSDKIQPTFDMQSAGTFQIFHTVENNICQDTTSRFITVLLPPKINVNDTVICGAAKLAINLTDRNASRYFLNKVATTPRFNITQNGTYAIRLENKGCFTEKSIKIKIVNFESPIKANDSLYCFNVPVPVILRGGFENIFWDNKPILDTFIIQDGAKHAFRATYSLDKDCIVKGEFAVLRKNCGSTIPDIIFVPNSFSPNDDGINDVFQAYPTKDAEILSLKIYNRWGSLIFQSLNGNEPWRGLANGTTLSPDVFVYLIQYKNKRTGRVEILSGDVTLVR